MDLGNINPEFRKHQPRVIDKLIELSMKIGVTLNVSDFWNPELIQEKIAPIISVTEEKNKLEQEILKKRGICMAIVRKILKLSQMDLVEILGSSRSHVWNAENGAVLVQNQIQIIEKLIALANEEGIALTIEDFDDIEKLKEKIVSFQSRAAIFLKTKVEEKEAQVHEQDVFQKCGEAIKVLREILNLKRWELRKKLGFKTRYSAQMFISRVERGIIKEKQTHVISNLIELAKERGIHLELGDFVDPEIIRMKLADHPLEDETLLDSEELLAEYFKSLSMPVEEIEANLREIQERRKKGEVGKITIGKLKDLLKIKGQDFFKEKGKEIRRKPLP